jgi:hypothetical protein
MGKITSLYILSDVVACRRATRVLCAEQRETESGGKSPVTQSHLLCRLRLSQGVTQSHSALQTKHMPLSHSALHTTHMPLSHSALHTTHMLPHHLIYITM